MCYFIFFFFWRYFFLRFSILLPILNPLVNVQLVVSNFVMVSTLRCEFEDLCQNIHKCKGFYTFPLLVLSKHFIYRIPSFCPFRTLTSINVNYNCLSWGLPRLLSPISISSSHILLSCLSLFSFFTCPHHFNSSYIFFWLFLNTFDVKPLFYIVICYFVPYVMK